MVVAKRPLAPPASARTSSTQQAQRARGKPPVAAPNGSDNTNSVAVELSHEDGPQNPDAVAVNGERPDNSPSSKKGPKSKSKSKQKKSAKKASRKIHRLGDYLFRTILIWLTIYTFALCPEDVRSERPVCRALSEYRRLVLEPYVLPPIRVALSHPSVVPYVEKAKPYTDRAFNTAKPVAQVIVRQWNARVAPQWNRHVVPLWYRYAIPQLLQLDAKVTPYRNRVTDEYERRVAPIVDSVSPYAQQAVVNARLLRSKARPYVMTAAHKTYDGYQYVAPYARPTWNKVKALVARFIALLAEQRRQFVDPHVRKIWERVKELSSGTPKVPAAVDVRASVSSRVSRAAEGAASVASSLMSSSTHAPDVTVPESQASDAPLVVNPDAQTETDLLPSTGDSTLPTSFSEAAVDITETVTSVASEVANTLEDTASVISALTSQPAVRVSSSISSLSDTVPTLASDYVASASESAFVAAESISSLLSSGSGVIGSSASSAVGAASTGILHASDALSSSIQRAASVASPESIASSASGIASAASSAVSSLAGRASSSGALTASAASVVPDIDLDAFAEELGLNDILAEASGSASGTAMDADTAPAPVDTEAAEEQERRRHKRLQETAEKRANVEARHSRWEDEQAALIENNKRSLRRALIALRKAAAAELRESTEIRAEIESFVARAEDLLKGAEKYLQTLVKDQRPDEEKRQLLERVLDKVNEKFTDRLSETEAVMNGWYAPWLDKEVAEVRKVAEAVKDHAENAQVDIGMDYAYLDDTTYQDWQRYHDLVRRSENFTQEAEAMQNGSSVSPPANALLKELKAIQTEVEDVVVGFETRLRRIRRNNARAFGESVKEDATDADDEIVSILPIEDKDKDKVQSPVDVDVPPVVIGRSKEEVMEALDRIVEADGDATSSPQATEQSADPESEVKGLVEEVSTGQSVPSIFPVASHEEL